MVDRRCDFDDVTLSFSISKPKITTYHNVLPFDSSWYKFTPIRQLIEIMEPETNKGTLIRSSNTSCCHANGKAINDEPIKGRRGVVWNPLCGNVLYVK